MKAVTLTLAATTVASASVPRALLNLRNHSLLNTSKDVSPLETIAHLATFEDVPVFGGFELREEMLKSIAEAKPSHFDQLTDSFFGAVTKATHRLKHARVDLAAAQPKPGNNMQTQQLPTVGKTELSIKAAAF